MFSRRPLIAVSGPDRGGQAAWLFIRISLFLTGARAKRITPSRPGNIHRLDGLILSGGADIDPAHYGDIRQKAGGLKRDLRAAGTGLFARLLYPLLLLFRALLSSKTVRRTDQERDMLELDLLKHAVRHSMPVLGICRGAQLINVHFGGTLYQDIADFYTESPNVWSIFPGKLINIKPATRLATALGEPVQCYVNALHNQAVKDTGEGIQVTAREPNGVIQAIEHTAYPFIVGVQWHPEYMVNNHSQRRLFRELVNIARKYRETNRSES